LFDTRLYCAAYYPVVFSILVNMRATAVVAACLAIAGHSRRMRIEDAASGQRESALASFFLASASAHARRNAPMRHRIHSPQMSTGLYYSTSTGNTETVAEYIANAAGVEDWKDIGDAEDSEVAGHDSIIVGAPTWHTDADQERSGTSWDEWLYNTLPNMDFSGKKVAIFGVGDSSGYGDNYCDAAGEIYDCFTERGAKVFGMTPSNTGFDYTESKSVRDDKFVGAVFDEDNYADESEARAQAWVEQLKSEGFM